MDERIGKIAYSKAGRDKGRPFVIISIVNEDFVMLADGDLRKIENPKLKNIKHIKVTNLIAEDVKLCLIGGKMPENHLIRKNIKKIQEDK
ncbi:MAG TPA: KOW domain-containing RNA-binding protein [Syntrophomonadaceae bacterium]|nr:KOW domain-containing RNA-binding protein [Syntrophomonadaceae bacterium]